MWKFTYNWRGQLHHLEYVWPTEVVAVDMVDITEGEGWICKEGYTWLGETHSLLQDEVKSADF